MDTATTIPAGTAALSVSDAITQRRSVRAYTPDALPQADLDAILRDAGLAPSAWNLQPWRFVVVRDPALKTKLAAAAYQQKQVLAAPAVIVLYTDMADTLAHLDQVVRPGTTAEQGLGFRRGVENAFAGQTEAQHEAWGFAQGHIALGFLLLSAQARGYSTSSMAGFDPEAVKQLLGLPANVRVPALVAIGRGTEEGLPHHRHGHNRTARFV